MHPDDPTAPRRVRRETRARTATVRILHVPAEPPALTRFELRTEPIVVGRSPGDGGIVVPDPHASRKHATLALRGDVLEIVDTSSDGTYVDGARVSRAEARDGAVLRCGDSFLLFRLEDPAAGDADVEGMLGTSPAIRALRELVGELASDPCSVLLLGESGTGKELVARGLHELSDRDGRFVAINCAAIPEHLAESALFGHVRGAFTGAIATRSGKFQQASGGTLFLDEIGEATPAVQAKLLRAIETRTVVPVGGVREIRCEVRIVAATLRELESAIEGGSFRGDLHARLADVVVQLPPLRERREDILPILAAALAPRAPRLDPELVAALLAHRWPYNVRELLKIATELRVRGGARGSLEHSLVAARLPAAGSPPTTHDASDDDAPAPDEEPSSAPRAEPTRDELAALFAHHQGNVSRIARALGYSRRHARRFLEQHGLR